MPRLLDRYATKYKYAKNEIAAQAAERQAASCFLVGFGLAQGRGARRSQGGSLHVLIACG